MISLEVCKLRFETILQDAKQLMNSMEVEKFGSSLGVYIQAALWGSWEYKIKLERSANLQSDSRQKDMTN